MAVTLKSTGRTNRYAVERPLLKMGMNYGQAWSARFRLSSGYRVAPR